VEIRNAQPKPMVGARLLLVDNGYFVETTVPLPQVRPCVGAVAGSVCGLCQYTSTD